MATGLVRNKNLRASAVIAIGSRMDMGLEVIAEEGVEDPRLFLFPDGNYDSGSPLKKVTKMSAPFAFFMGEVDRNVVSKHGVIMATGLQDLGVPAVFRMGPGKHHFNLVDWVIESELPPGTLVALIAFRPLQKRGPFRQLCLLSFFLGEMVLKRRLRRLRGSA